MTTIGPEMTLFAFFEISICPSKRVSMGFDENFCLYAGPMCKNTTTESQTTKLLYNIRGAAN